MSAFEVKTTVSHRYYARKRKSEIVERIRDLELVLSRREVNLGGDLPETLAKSNAELRAMSADRLATVAIRLHTYFPEHDE